jgi:hypothetical protein
MVRVLDVTDELQSLIVDRQVPGFPSYPRRYLSRAMGRACGRAADKLVV